MNIFDHIKNITTTKGSYLGDEGWNNWMINRYLSMDQEYCEVVNIVQKNMAKNPLWGCQRSLTIRIQGALYMFDNQDGPRSPFYRASVSVCKRSLCLRARHIYLHKPYP